MNVQRTIAAISTAPGQGAIAIVRLSGQEAIKIAESIFQSPVGKFLSEQKTNTIHFGQIIQNEKLIDEVIVSIFREPHSYTGEDIVEISCHGSIYIQQKILEILITKGAQLAQPGEFTLRAFLNGKLDLSQAEGVADLIASSSEAMQRVALRQMRGGFSDELKTLRQKLVDFASLIELELDFSEEDVEFADRKQFKELVEDIGRVIHKLSGSFSFGNVIKNGVPVTIIGEPNVGKSTLLNILLKEEKAIVSEIPGTTRDVVEDIINIHGIMFRFIDTAGIRDTTDHIESLGISRTYDRINKASVILMLLDANDIPTHHISNIIKIKKYITSEKHLLVILNKADKIDKQLLNAKIEEISDSNEVNKADIIAISAKHDQGINELIMKLVDIIHADSISPNDTIVTNVRHFEALVNAEQAVIRVKEGLQTGLSNDLIAQDIREILYYLGTITGEITTDELLKTIFGKFCIGK